MAHFSQVLKHLFSIIFKIEQSFSFKQELFSVLDECAFGSDKQNDHKSTRKGILKEYGETFNQSFHQKETGVFIEQIKTLVLSQMVIFLD